MKKQLMAGALAVAMWSVPALAGEYTTTTTTSTEAPAAVEAEVATPTTEMEATPSDTKPTSETVATPAIEEQNNYNMAVSPPAEPKQKESRSDMRGLTVLLGGGVEGYSGDLAPQVAAGPAWGVRAALKPTKVLGIELGYSGAVNEIRNGSATGTIAGADIVRNGGEAVATVGLTAAPVQPYLLGGVGVSRYSVRGAAANFQDDTTGNIPVGGGLRTHIGNFTADARFGYSFLFDNQFASNVAARDLGPVDSTSGGRYQGTLNLGSTF